MGFSRSLISIILMSLFLINCGGSGSSDMPDPFLKLISVSPVGENVPVSSNFKLNFDAPISPDSLKVNPDADITNILDELEISVSNRETAEAIDSGITLKMLLESKNIMATKYDPELDSNTVLVVTNIKWNNGNIGEDLLIETSSHGPIVVDNETLKANNVFLQTAIKLVGADNKKVDFTLKVKDSKITLSPKEYLNWESTYTLTVSKAVVSTKGYKLEKQRVISFTTEIMPEPKVEWVDPMGSQASVLKPVTFKPNFDVIEDSIESSVFLYKINLDGTETPVEGSVSLDDISNEVTFSPSALEYSTNYKLVVKGGTRGISGVMRPAVVYLAEDHVSYFQTLAPGVISNFPEDGTNGVPNEELIVELELNFYPTNQSVNSSTIQIIDTVTQEVVSSTYTVDLYYVYALPETLKYDHKYKVVMTTGVQSESEISMAQNYEFEFTTWKRQVLSHTPADSAISDDESLKPTITVNFNFDVDPISIDSNSFNVSTSRDKYGVFEVIQGTYGFPNSRTVTFKPKNAAEYFTFFNVELNSNIKETDTNQPMGIAKSFKFRTLNRDLSVVKTFPAQDAVEVPIDAVISAEFNLVLDSSSGFMTNPVQVYEQCTGDYLSGSISISDNKVYFVPQEILASSCDYTVTLSKDIVGLNNEQQTTVNEFSWKFTTDSLKPINFTADYVADSNVTYVGTSIDIDFNKPLLSSSFRYSDIKIENIDDYYYSEIDFDYYINGSRLIITPYNLDYGTRYKIIVKDNASLRSSGGERITADYSFTFKTEPTPVTVIDYYPSGNYVDVDEDIYVYFNLYTSDDGFPEYKDYFFSSSDDDTQVKIDVNSYGGYVPSFSDYSSSNYIELSHYSDFDYDETYSVDVEIYYPDLEGTIFERDYFYWSFTTTFEPIEIESQSTTSKSMLSVKQKLCHSKYAFCRKGIATAKPLTRQKKKPVITKSQDSNFIKTSPYKRLRATD